MVFIPPALPEKPGVYLYKDNLGKIIYVGKAKSLKKRVASYFNKEHEDDKTKLLVKNITDMDFIVTNNEVEAFLLENRLIKQNKPEYNILLKDNERYAYITITNEEYPRLMTARQIIDPKAKYFGPYTSGTTRIQLQRTLSHAFKIRSCKVMPKQVCLYYHIGRCSGPCQNKISKEEYHANVQKAAQYLQGKGKELIEQLEQEMKEYSKKLDFERAAQKRDAIQALQSIQEQQSVDTVRNFNQDVFGTAQGENSFVVTVFNLKKGSIIKKSDFKFNDVINTEDILAQLISQYYEEHDIPAEIIVDTMDESSLQGLQEWLTQKAGAKVDIIIPQKAIKKKLLDMAKENATYALDNQTQGVIRLQKSLKLPELPKVIECFDISTIQGKHTVASMVQFVNGKPNKNEYRRFKIKTVDLSQGPNDFASMQEVVARRYWKLKLNNELMPDLIMIDGGKGQLSVAMQELQKLELSIPIIALAKREEEIYVPGLQWPIRLSKRDEALKLLQRIRNEAHRFAITYHRLLRDKKRLDEEKLDVDVDTSQST